MTTKGFVGIFLIYNLSVLESIEKHVVNRHVYSIMHIYVLYNRVGDIAGGHRTTNNRFCPDNS